MMNMWDEMKNIKAPDELKARTRAAVREEKGRARQPARSIEGRHEAAARGSVCICGRTRRRGGPSHA